MIVILQDDSKALVPARSPKTRRAVRWLIGYWLLLVILTHWPSPWPNVHEPKYFDKVVHFSFYCVLASLALNALALRTETAPGAMRCAVVLAGLVAFGLLDEATQPLTHRDFDWFDWLADSLGALTGIAAYNYWRPRGRMSSS